jgi:hypothetical protein
VSNFRADTKTQQLKTRHGETVVRLIDHCRPDNSGLSREINTSSIMDEEDVHRVEPLIPQHTPQTRRRKHTRTRTGTNSLNRFPDELTQCRLCEL